VPPIGTSAVQTTKASLLYRQNKRNSLEGFKGIGPDNDAYRCESVRSLDSKHCARTRLLGSALVEESDHTNR